MTDYSAWKISASTILFLIACAWHNRRTGFRKFTKMDNALDASPIWHTAPEPGPWEISVQEQTRQLINLKLALQPDPKNARQISSATQSASVGPRAD
jgi:hypothetical protein